MVIRVTPLWLSSLSPPLLKKEDGAVEACTYSSAPRYSFREMFVGAVCTYQNRLRFVLCLCLSSCQQQLTPFSPAPPGPCARGTWPGATHVRRPVRGVPWRAAAPIT